jgi:hypothetical protein
MARKKLDFAAMVAKGENVHGFRAQTAECTEKDEEGPPYLQYNYVEGADGNRWNSWPEYAPNFPSPPTRRGRKR